VESNPFLLVCFGLGMLLISQSLRVLRWAQFARGVRDQQFHSGRVPSLDVDEEESQEALHNEMLTAGRCLLEALERQHALNRRASKSGESIASSLQEARQLVDSAADDYVRATQRFRSSAPSIRFSTGKRVGTSRRIGNASPI
jgi:hypothetical protein